MDDRKKTFDRLAIQQRHRAAALRQAIRLGNTARAMVQNVLGWSPTLAKQERNRIKREAASLVKAIGKGEQVSLSEGLIEFVELQLSCAKMERKLVQRYEAQMVELVRELPEAGFVADLVGLSLAGLAIILGAAGDPRGYGKPCLLWRRFGVGHVGGERQRRVLDKELAEQLGHCPRRRAIMFNASDALIKHNSDGYRALYDERKKVTMGPARNWPKGHAHADGLRLVAKRLLRELWCFSNEK